MATSGTATFNLDFDDIIEEAYERCGLETRTGYDMRTARRSLSIMLMEWANRGLNLWTIEQRSVTLVAGTNSYNLPQDTVNILSAVVRTGSGSTQQDITLDRISQNEYLRRLVPLSTSCSALRRRFYLYILPPMLPAPTLFSITQCGVLRMLEHSLIQRM